MMDHMVKHIQGSTDGMKKNPILIFKVYLALKRYADASKSAFFIAEKEFIKGNFNKSRNILLFCQ